MADKITLIFNITLIVFIFFGVFWGLIRGLRRTLSRTLFLLITGVIALFITVPIVKALINIPFSMTVDTYGEITQEKFTLVTLIEFLLENYLGETFVTKYSTLASSLVAIPLLLINTIAYVIIFWLLKILLLPINSLFTAIFFRPKKRKETVGFCAMNNTEYPNSDKSIEALDEVYKKSQQQSEVGLFIKKEDEIAKDAPSARARRLSAETKSNTEEAQPLNTTQPQLSKEEKKKQQQQLKQSQKQELKEKKNNKPKKYRLLGGTIGILAGIVVMFNTLIPVYGILNIISRNKSIELTNLSDKTISIDTISNNLGSDIIKGYELSALGRISKMLGIEKLGIDTFDKLTSTTIDNQKVVLREDVNTLVKVVQQVDKTLGTYKTINQKGLSNITQEELNSLINDIETTINKTEQVKLIDTFSTYIIPIAVEYIVYNEIKLSDNEAINQATIDTLVAISQDNSIEIFNELKALVNIAKYLSDQGLLIKIVTNDYSDILNVIDNLDDDFSEQLSNKIFSIRTLNSTIPNLLNTGLTIFDEMAGFGYEENNATSEEIKSSMTSLIESFVSIGRSLSYDSPIYATDNSLVAIGNLLDTFRNSKLFNITTYNNLVDYAVDMIKQNTIELVPDNFKNTFNNHILRNICEVTDWKEEMSTIADALTILRDKENGILGSVVEGQTNRIGYSINFRLHEDTFINLGKALDKLEQSTLLGTPHNLPLDSVEYNNTTIVSVINSAINELILSKESEGIINDLKDIIELMTNNLIKDSHSPSTDSSFWENEMSAISPLIIRIYDMTKSDSLDISADLGPNLDKCTSSVFLGEDTTLRLMNKMIKIVKDQMYPDYISGQDDMDDKVYTLLTDIENNLLSSQLYEEMQADNQFWTKEVNAILSLKEIANEASEINTISDAKLLASDLDIVYTSRIIPRNSLNNTISTIIRKLKSDTSEGIDGKINNLIDNIANDIENPDFFTDKNIENFWSIELSHMETLLNLELSDNEETGYTLLDNLNVVGNALDKVTRGNNDIRNSYLITENRVREVLSSAITDIKSSISGKFNANKKLEETVDSVVSDIAKNMYNSETQTQIAIPSFTIELGYLTQLSNLKINADLFKYTSDTTSLLGELQELGANLDSIAFNMISTQVKAQDNNSYVDGFTYDDNNNSKLITRKSINSIISSAFGMALTGGEDNMYVNLIGRIQTSINDINGNLATSTPEKVISWKRELSYVATLIQLNSGLEYSLDNASTTIATQIDLIGFNTLSDGTFADVEYNQYGQILIANTYEYLDKSTTKYYNSTIITRDILKSTINDLLITFKTEVADSTAITKDTIANELIDNLSKKINTITTNDTAYNNYTSAFGDLDEITDTMKDTADAVDGKQFADIDGAKIDTMLSTFQNKIVCGAITTRKIAILIVDKINTTYQSLSIPNFDSSEAGKYLSNLTTYYNTYISSDVTDKYIDTDTNTTISKYPNPFATLITKSIIAE